MEPELINAADAVLQAARARGWQLATAESCTGGMVAAALTEIAGSSDVVERGFVTYSNNAKNELLGVPMSVINRVGAVSEEVARAMAKGACKAAGVHLACGITGVAGPGGGTADKPVGLVHIAAACTRQNDSRPLRIPRGSPRCASGICTQSVRNDAGIDV